MARQGGRSTTALVAVLDPRGQPTAEVEPLPLAPRLDTLRGRTVYFIDVGFGGGWEFLEEAVDWFHRHLPEVKTVLERKRGIMFADEPETWARIQQDGDAVVFGVGG